MSSQYFTLERKEGVEILTITRPDVLNALNFQLLGELRDYFTALRGDAGVKVLIITGQGEKAFCAGADIPELRGRHIMSEREGIQLGQEVMNRLEAVGKPTIAAINGFALGGGLEMAPGLHLPAGRPQRPFGPARTQPGPAARLWRHPAPAPPGGGRPAPWR